VAILDSKRACALTLLFIALTDLSVALDVPVLRQALGFLMLTFLPGFFLIQILRVTKNPVEKTLFVIGLSVSFLMFIPLMMDFAYPALGISHPLSLLPLTTTISLALGGLSLVAYRTGALDLQITASDFKILIERIRSPPVLGVGLVLVLGILGALFIRFYSDSLFSLFSVATIAAVVILLVTCRRVSERYYPLYVFAIALALLYLGNLASPNLFGRDIFSELYFADLVRSAGFWDPNFTVSNVGLSDYWAMLSVTILPNVYSILLNVDNAWVYELVIPFIFAFVPVGLYQLWKTQLKFSNKLAFLSAFFFMSYFSFVDPVPRQLVAEFFLVLILLLILSTPLQGSKKTALLILFIGSLTVSHYSTTYLFVGYLAILLIGSALIGAKSKQKQSRSVVSATLVALVVAIVFGWYIFASGGAPYQALQMAGTTIAHSLTNDFLGPPESTVATGLGVGIQNLPFSHALYHYWIIATEVLIVAGLAFVTWRRKALRVNTQFLLLSFASFILMLAAIAVPSVAGVINGNRLFALALLFLAPYCILGIEAIVCTTSSWIRANGELISKLKCAALIGVLIPYFLFTYGFIWEVTEHPSNYAFLPSQEQSERVVEYSLNGSTWSYMVQAPISTQDVYAAKWLSTSASRLPVYADFAYWPEVRGYANVSPDSNSSFTPAIANHSLNNAYVYLGAADVQSGNIALTLPNSTYQIQPFSSYPALTVGNLVYSNGLAEVRYYP
jgi:uncharacterized membrane protein